MTNEELEKRVAELEEKNIELVKDRASDRELIEGLNERIENLESTKNVINSIKIYELNNVIRNLKILLDAKNTKEHD